MPSSKEVIALVQESFASAKYPSDHLLLGSTDGDEPFRVERDFRGKRDWRSLSPEFIDCSPGGLATALCFFSHEAFCFYLPAYLVADLKSELKRVEPVFHLTRGLERSSAKQRINPRRYGNKTWGDLASQRFASFTRQQAAAIAAYLTFKRDATDVFEHTRQAIDHALESYWHKRAG